MDAQSKSWNVRDDLKGLSLDEIKAEHAKIDKGYAICTLNVTGDLNIGTIMRSAVIFGASEMFVFGRRQYDRRSTVGAQNYIKTTFVDGMKSDTEIDCDAFMNYWDWDKYYPVCIDKTWFSEEFQVFLDNDLDFKCISLKKMPVFIFGNEGMGIPDDILNAFGRYQTFHIPQLGILRSLNVAVAASIVMYEMSKL